MANFTAFYLDYSITSFSITTNQISIFSILKKNI